MDRASIETFAAAVGISTDDMGVCVQRNPVRPELGDLGQCPVKRLWCLLRQAINQVHIDRFKTALSCRINQRKYLLGRLNPMDRLLHRRVKVLNPKTQTIETQLKQGVQA